MNITKARFVACFLDIICLNVFILIFENVFDFEILIILIEPIYYVAFHTLNGQTLGKMFAQIKVVCINQKPANLKTIIIREIPLILITIIALITYFITNNFGEHLYDRFLGVYTFWLLIDFIFIFSNSKRQSIHDIIAKTFVIKT